MYITVTDTEYKAEILTDKSETQQTLASYSSVYHYSNITWNSAFIRSQVVVSDSTQAQLE